MFSRITHHVLFVLFLLLTTFSCEKEHYFVETEAPDSPLVEQRSTKEFLVQRIVKDRAFLEIFLLSTVDNYVLQAYMEGQVDTTALWSLFDELGIDYSTSLLKVNNEDFGFYDYSDFKGFIEKEFSDPQMAEYFEALRQNGMVFLEKFGTDLSNLDPRSQELVLSEAYGILLSRQRQMFTNEVVTNRSGECSQCFINHADCMRNTNMNAASAFGGALSAGGITGAMMGPGFGVGLLGGLLGGAVSGGFTYAIGYHQCQSTLNHCLSVNGCGSIGGAGGWGGYGPCLECIIPT
jgi:hypothetical protein